MRAGHAVCDCSGGERGEGCGRCTTVGDLVEVCVGEARDQCRSDVFERERASELGVIDMAANDRQEIHQVRAHALDARCEAGEKVGKFAHYGFLEA